MNQVFAELQSAIHSVWHRRWTVLGVAWAVSILGWLVVALIPNSYESKARIFVELDDVLTEQIGIAGGGEKEIQRVRQTLASSVNLEKVIRATQLGDDVSTQREMEGAIESLSKRVEVSSEQDNLFELTAVVGKSSLSDSENAKLSQDVVQKLIDIFREENIAGNRGDVAETIVFLDQQLESRKKELEAAEQRRLAFEAKYPDLIGGMSSLSNKMERTRSDLRDVDADLAAAVSSLAAINGQVAGTPRTIMTNGPEGGARAALAQAQTQLAGLRARGLTDAHPDVAAATRQVVLLRQQVAAEGPNVSGTQNPAYTSLMSIRAERQANVEALQARRAALQSDMSSMIASQADEPAVAAEANRISRDYEVLKNNYDELLQNREEMRLRGQVENERSSFKFEVIDPPTVPRTPAAPNRPLLLIGVLFAGIAAGVGVAFALSQIRSTFTTEQKLENTLELPVLGTISHTLTDAARAVQKQRLRKFVAGCAGLACLCVVLLAVEFVQRGMVA